MEEKTHAIKCLPETNLFFHSLCIQFTPFPIPWEADKNGDRMDIERRG